MILFESLWESIFSEKNFSTSLSGRSPLREVPAETIIGNETKKHESSQPSNPQYEDSKKLEGIYADPKYGEDFMKLEAAIGKVQQNSNLIFELLDLVKIVPRHRVRVEAYQGFKSALKRYLNVDLTIKSLKTK